MPHVEGEAGPSWALKRSDNDHDFAVAEVGLTHHGLLTPQGTAALQTWQRATPPPLIVPPLITRRPRSRSTGIGNPSSLLQIGQRL